VAVPGVDDILARMRAHGGRITVQRRLVIDALLRGPRHRTAEDLAASIQAENPEVHLSTVYRTLESLEHQGVVQHAHFGHGPAVYHLADAEHLHLVCECCDRVVEVPRSAYAAFERMLADEYRFTVSPHHFAVQGRCAGCTDKPPRRHSGN
jgi:Fe2+ or Zn2+ uptake regulation protein